MTELLDLLEERPPLGVERPGVALGEIEARAARGEHLLHGGPILHDPSEVQHV